MADGDAPPVESAYGRYLAPVANRWVNVAAAVAFIALGVFQLASGSFPFYLVLGLSWAVVAVWSWWMPVIVISLHGPWRGRRAGVKMGVGLPVRAAERSAGRAVTWGFVVP